jgi:hypothetical protein
MIAQRLLALQAIPTVCATRPGYVARNSSSGLHRTFTLASSLWPVLASKPSEARRHGLGRRGPASRLDLAPRRSWRKSGADTSHTVY